MSAATPPHGDSARREHGPPPGGRLPAGPLRGRRAGLPVLLAIGALALLALPLGLTWVTGATLSSADVAQREATFLRATRADLDPDLARMFAAAGQPSGTEWEILAAISQVVNNHGRSAASTTTTAFTTSTSTATPDPGAADPAARRAAETARVWPVSDVPISRTEAGVDWVTAMLLRDDATDLDPTRSLDAAREVGLQLQQRLAEIPDHRPDRSFEAQPTVYEQAITTLPLRGLDASVIDVSPVGASDRATEGAGDGATDGATDPAAATSLVAVDPLAAATTVGMASTARSTASRIVALAMGWRTGGACGGGGTGLSPYPTNGPINVGDRLAVGGVMTPTMMANAQVIVEVARRHGLDEQAMVIAIITALQESGLQMLASRAVPESAAFPHDAIVAGDNDSINTFQQRVSMGWGSIAQLMDPFYAAEAFFGVGRAVGSSGLTRVPGWQRLAPTVAAQAVQRSAFPNAYAKWVPDGAGIVESILSSGGTVGVTGASTVGGVPDVDATTPATATTAAPSSSTSPRPTRLVSSGGGAAGACGWAGGTWSGPIRELPAPGGAVVAVADLALPGGGTITVNAAIADRVAALYEAAAADGVVLGGSGWRSTATQERLRVQNGCPDVFTAPSSACRVPTARPGSSQHEVGLAIDFSQNGASLCGRPGCGGYTGYQWLRANAATFGLINLPSEPWHWSTTGR